MLRFQDCGIMYGLAQYFKRRACWLYFTRPRVWCNYSFIPKLQWLKSTSGKGGPRNQEWSHQRSHACKKRILLYLQGFPVFLITNEIVDQDTLGLDSTDQIWRRRNIMLAGNMGTDVVVFISYNQLGKISTSTFSIQDNQFIEAEWCIYASVNWQPLIQIMACRLVGAKPLSEPVMEHC